MQVANTKLRDFYQAELSALRREGLAFAEQYPEVAHMLGLNSQQARDPQVELLLQSFAFLSGRLRHQIEVNEAGPANALLNSLYPHLAAPVPSMLVAEMDVKPDGSNFSKTQTLARGRYLTAPATNHLGKKINCRFRTCCDTPLLPLKVTDIEAQALEGYELLTGRGRAHSVLRVRLQTVGVGSLSGKARVRLFINPNEPNAYALYDLLAVHMVGLRTQVPANAAGGEAGPPRPIGMENFRWLGEREDEAMLPANPHTHPGYRLLQEYFSFPEKFLFFEIADVDFDGVQTELDLFFLLDTPAYKAATFAPETLRMNCVPLINLFSQRLDPLTLDHRQYEYRLLGDLENHRYCEIYAIESLESIGPNGEPRTIAPYFGMDDVDRLEQQDYFYVTRREASLGANVAGCETFVSFLDSKFDLAKMADEVVGGRALCTNRRLPEQLLSGASLYLEGAGPVGRICVLTKPTAHQAPPIIGMRPWSLVSQLSLNHLSLAEGEQAMSALKDILRLHAGPNQESGWRQIEGIVDVQCRAIVRHRHIDGWRGFVRGLDIRLEIDMHFFQDASPVLFCAALRHFLSSYATVNNVIEVSMKSSNDPGVIKQWQPQNGAQTIL